MKALIFCVLLVTTCLAVAPTDKISIDIVNADGSGCPTGTVSVSVLSDNSAFTVAYSKYLAQVGVGASSTDFRKNCQISLSINVPQGYSYAVNKVDYRGFAHLESGATASLIANYYFQGISSISTSYDFQGPLDDNWEVSNSSSNEYSPCNESINFNINTGLRVNAGTSDPTSTTSFITMDSTDGSINTIYYLEWKNC